MLYSLFPQSLSKFSLVYLVIWHPPLHTPYISSSNHYLLFAAHAHTIAACFAVVPRLCHLILVSLSLSQLFTWNSILYDIKLKTVSLLSCTHHIIIVWLVLQWTLTFLQACSTRFYTRWQAVSRPMLTGARSDSMVRRQVRCGRPDRWIQSLGKGATLVHVTHTICKSKCKLWSAASHHLCVRHGNLHSIK